MSAIIAIMTAVMATARGRVVRVVYHTAPTSEAVRENRAKQVAARALSSGAMIARVSAHDTATNDGGTIATLAVRFSPRNDDAARDTFYTSKAGSALARFIMAAPAEHTIGGALVPTACPNAGRDGTACADLAPRHGHRSLTLSRIVAIECGGETLYRAASCECGETHSA
jgi:hypothetical protein